MRKYELELRAVDGLGLSEVQMDLLVTLVNGFVRGTVGGVQEKADAERVTGITEDQWWAATEPYVAQVFDAERYPTAARVGPVAGEELGAYDPAAVLRVRSGAAARRDRRADPRPLALTSATATSGLARRRPKTASRRRPRTGMLGVVSRPLDPERCYRAVAGRDARFDGWFFTAVHTTGIYCRPSCPARTPLARNVSFFTTAAAAQGAGFRACRRCRPDAVPGSPEWDVRADVVARAMRLIADGEVERSGVPGLAARLGYSERQLHRLLVAELGVGAAGARPGPARADRAAAHRDHRPADGRHRLRGRVRQHPAVQRHRPRGLRDDADRPAAAPSPGTTGGAPGWLTLRLAARAPYEAAEVLLFLGAHAVPGLEEWDGTTFSRVLDLPHGPAVVQLSPAPDGGPARHRPPAAGRAARPRRRRHPVPPDARPRRRPDRRRRRPRRRPRARPAGRRRARPAGARLPRRRRAGGAGGARPAGVGGRRPHADRAGARAAGTPLPEPVGTLTHAFPRPDALADADLTAVGLTGARRRTVHALAAALADGDDRPRPRRRPRGGRPGAARRPRHRPVDGGARRTARPGRPRRLAARRPRAAEVAGRPRQLRRRRRHPLAAVAVLRRPAPVGARRAVPLHPPRLHPPLPEPALPRSA